MLLDKGADVNAVGGKYGSALQAASAEGYDKVVQMLLKKGVDVSTQDGYNCRALQAASAEGHDKIVHILLDKGADVNAQGGRYSSTLQAGSSRGHVKVVQLLLSRGANFQDETEDGTALHAAVLSGCHVIAQILLTAGALVGAPDKLGWTASDLAYASHDLAMLGALGLGNNNNRLRELTSSIPAAKFRAVVSSTGLCVVDDGLTITSGIGLCREVSETAGMPGWSQGSWGYHGDDGCTFAETGLGRQSERYSSGDVVGCGINLESGTVFFTKNGAHLGDAFKGVTGRLFPVVGIGESNTHLQVILRPEGFMFTQHT
ncbi:hypothetical protein D6D03_03431 [Aureobasidium pullulans]|nr:hypothetical protein D6D03_03431 [Aureobasidium pullulans]